MWFLGSLRLHMAHTMMWLRAAKCSSHIDTFVLVGCKSKLIWKIFEIVFFILITHFFRILWTAFSLQSMTLQMPKVRSKLFWLFCDWWTGLVFDDVDGCDEADGRCLFLYDGQFARRSTWRKQASHRQLSFVSFSSPIFMKKVYK